MVLIINFSYDLFTHQIAEAQRSTYVTINPRVSSTEQENRLRRTYFIRQSLIDRGFSPETATVIISSWRKGTRKQYDLCFRKWVLWCGARNANPLSPSEKLVLDYLVHLVKLKLSYSLVNTHNSMLTQTLPFFGISWCDNNKLISRFMKGFFNIKPIVYKPKVTWDVSKVVKYISSLFPLRSLSLKMLTLKLITLVALTTASRAQTLAALDTSYMTVFHDRFVFDICYLLKTTRPERQNPNVVLAKFHDPCLCVYLTLEEYLRRTADLRKSSLLFISYVTYKAVCTSTLARWLKFVLMLSGIDLCYKAHSFRSASTSCVFQKGVSIKDIMNTANWSSAQTFYKYYYKEVQSDNTFANAVLNT